MLNLAPTVGFPDRNGYLLLRTSFLGLAFYLGASGLGFSQPAAPENDFMQARRDRFEATTPAIGEPMPDLSAYDEDGGELELSSLKGSYTVLVFGCLT